MLDEVGEIPLALQGKLLRVLQEGTYERVGDDRTRTVDVRIIAATNRDLRAQVERGHFRQDLYFRLNVFPIEVPALRERRDDIATLAQHFLNLACQRNQRPPLKLTTPDVGALQSYDWPGNIRELQNVMERAAITSRSGRLLLELPGAPSAHAAGLSRPLPDDTDVLTDGDVRAIERDNTLRVLERTGWKLAGPGGAAELLGIKPSTLTSRIKKMGLAKAK